LLPPQITHPSFKAVTTQIFPSDDPYLSTDSVFAVKNDLVVDFKPRKGDDKASLDLEYNVILAPKDVEGAGEANGDVVNGVVNGDH
jgi:catechol 1,2-dioxygenase